MAASMAGLSREKHVARLSLKSHQHQPATFSRNDSRRPRDERSRLMVWHVSVSYFHGPVEAASTNAVRLPHEDVQRIRALVDGRFGYWVDPCLALPADAGQSVDMDFFRKETEAERHRLEGCLDRKNANRRKAKRAELRPLDFPNMPTLSVPKSDASALELANHIKELLGAWLSTEKLRCRRAVALDETEPLRALPPQWSQMHQVIDTSKWV